MRQSNHRSLLVVMDYVTKWVDVPSHCLIRKLLATFADAVIKLCSSFGMLGILHSDQGRNFEVTLTFRQVIQAFGILENSIDK